MQRPLLTQLRGGPVAKAGDLWKRLPGQATGKIGSGPEIVERDETPQVALNDEARFDGPPGDAEPVSRFQAGALRPADEIPARAGRSSGKRVWRLFDKLLLAGEIISALVVTWLVAQYIYTAYIDTGTRRPGPAHLAGRTPTVTGTPAVAPTRTPMSEVAPPLQGGPPAAQGQGRGRTPPAAPGFLGAVESAVTPTITPTATPTVDPELLLPVRLRIPVMFLDSPVHEVTVNMGQWEVSPMDIGHHEGSANPGEVGNVVLAGHRDINSALFRDLDRLEPGDEVYVSNSVREYKYVVTESFVVNPSHTEVMDPTDDKRVTLITCTPVGLATQRLIVTAILEEAPGDR